MKQPYFKAYYTMKINKCKANKKCKKGAYKVSNAEFEVEIFFNYY